MEIEYDVEELRRIEPKSFRLARKMARMLRDKFGAEAESKLPACRELARKNGDDLQIETVRMAEKFLVGME